MANSRKSPALNRDNAAYRAFERALGEILARVFHGARGAAPALAVAYSGGLDSTVLLHFAAIYAAEHRLALSAFHVHHGLSPDAGAWLAHCELQCRQLGVAFAARSVQLAADGRGVEETARLARYAALGELCRASGVALLLSAHHRDDQAETVLLQLLRGAGLPGLSGMPELQMRHALLGPDVALGRPLLAMPRSLLEQVIRDAGLHYVTDESNADLRFRRNALRHAVVPQLERHFPGFSARVSRSAMHAQAAQGLLRELAIIDLAGCQADAQGNALDLPRLKQLSKERADNLLRYWLSANGVPLPGTARLAALRRQMLDAQPDAHPVVEFGDVTLRRMANRLLLQRRAGAAPPAALPLQWTGAAAIDVPQWRGRILFEPANGPGLDPQALRDRVITLRARRGQERLKLAINRPSRSLKNLFQEAAIAPWRRAWSPLVYVGDELVFVAGLGMDVRHLTCQHGMILRWETEC